MRFDSVDSDNGDLDFICIVPLYSAFRILMSLSELSSYMDGLDTLGVST